MLNFAKITLPIAQPLKRVVPPVNPPNPGSVPINKGGGVRPNRINNLIIWLKGIGLPSSGSISTWNDSSGNGNTASWDGDGVHPTVGILNGYHTCEMPSGAGGMLSNWSSTLSSGTTWTIFGVMKVAAAGGATMAVIYKSSNFGVAAGVSLDGSRNLNSHLGLTAPTDTWFCFVWRQTPPGGITYLNGKSFTDSSPLSDPGMNSIWVGEGLYGGFAGGVVEIAVWDGDIGDSNAVGLLRYARNKYKIRF
jgi:hypothetical protein